MERARETAASFARNPMFLDMVVDGIDSDGTVYWELAGIVRALKESVEHNATNDWLRHDVAQAWMAQHHPDQTPERYTCKTWPQVLHESRAFRLEYRPENGRKVAWIRARDRW